jgi:hypothetical protein
MKGIPKQFYYSLNQQEDSLIWQIEHTIIAGRLNNEPDSFDTKHTPLKVFLNERLHKQLSKKSNIIRNETISYSLGNAGLFHALLTFRKHNHVENAENLEAIKKLMNNTANPNNCEIWVYKDYLEEGSLTKVSENYLNSYEPFCCAITYTESSRNQLAKISKMVVHEYATNVTKSINEAIICHDLTFLLYEIYNLTVHYEAEDFDSHLTDDIPELPYSNYRNDLLGAYICLPENGREDEVVEYLFITENQYHHVKLTNYYNSQYEDSNGIINKVRYPYNSLKTKSYKRGKSIQIFGSDTLLTPDGLTVLEMEHFGSSNLKFITDFTVDEEKLQRQLTNDGIGYADNTRLAKMLIDYYTIHKGSWITSKQQRRTTYTPTLIDLDYKFDFKSNETPVTLVNQYWLWKNGAQLLGQIPDSLKKIIMRKALQDVEILEHNKRYSKIANIVVRSFVGLIGISLLYFFW